MSLTMEPRTVIDLYIQKDVAGMVMDAARAVQMHQQNMREQMKFDELFATVESAV